MTPIEDLRLSIEAAIGLAQGALARLDTIEQESRNQAQISAEIAELRMVVVGPKGGGKITEPVADPLMSNTQLFELMGVSRHSEAARQALVKIPAIEISPGRFKRRRSAVMAYVDSLERGTAKAA